MRRTGPLFSFVDLDERVPKRHPLRKIRQIVNEALIALARTALPLAGSWSTSHQDRARHDR
jgi:hypothetical protein